MESPTTPSATAPSEPVVEVSAAQEAARLRDLSAEQWKSGAAAWLGWLFDGLDMQLYVVVATPFVAELLHVQQKDPAVDRYSSVIQAAFLLGWALGGGFFGRIGDRLGRSRALMLTILTYTAFTSLSFFAQTWWHLLIFRFVAALGIGGEWGVGASLLSETWPRRWRPWLAGVLQSAVNIGVALASLGTYLLAAFPTRSVFLVGVLPALLVVWIRRTVPEPHEWQAARAGLRAAAPGIPDLFRGAVRRTTVLTLLVCALALTAHWAYAYWSLQYVRHLPEVGGWTDADKTRLVSSAVWLQTVSAIVGNFAAAALARRLGYRRAIILLCVAYCAAMLATYGPAHHPVGLWVGMAAVNVCQGLFALFTMYMPPLFPTLLRTTGAGFCYNLGRIAAGAGIVLFAFVSPVGDYRLALCLASVLFIPAAGVALLLPEPPESR